MSSYRRIILPSLIALGSLAYITFSVSSTLVEIQAIKMRAAAEESAFEVRRAAIAAALMRTGEVSITDVQKGFWISYVDAQGNEAVYKIDVEALARSGASASEITQLVTAVKDGAALHNSTIRDVPDATLPDNLRFHNALYAAPIGGTSTLDIHATLEGRWDRGSATPSELLQLGYLRELEGDYAGRDAVREEACAKDPSTCGTGISVRLVGRVVDASGNAVQGASVSVISQDNVPAALTSPDGRYSLSVRVHPIEKVRVRAIKRNYSDGFTDIVVLDTPGRTSYELADIRIESPANIITIDFVHRSVTGSGNTFNDDGSIVVRTSRSTYEIPPGAIVHLDGTPYKGGTADVYLYEFSREAPPESLMQVDTFDQVMGYAGNLMKTFGMPYVQFFTPSGEELHVLSSRPIILTYMIADMDALRENADRIYRPLTDADMQQLVEASRQGGYPIDRAYLIEHQLLQFPAFWVFDRRRGIWDNIGIAVRNTQGLIVSHFYTIRDAL